MLYAAFALSGLVGLIYEASWTRYLQLFLGHAAYAQVLVIALFMGGMGAGALLASRVGGGRLQPLVVYALIEGALGIAGFAFHPVFDIVTSSAYDTWLPALHQQVAGDLLQWLLAAALIVPQSLLLGMTFPLMSAAVLRLDGQQPGGRVFALLYFFNSAGAVIGVLLSGFWLTEQYGLQATMMIAGTCNLVVAAVALLVARRAPRPTALPRPAAADTIGRATGIGLLTIAFMTAVSSFLYEIAWLRMLALVQGASTHAFETMLSAFILGIALGGLWIRNRIEKFKSPLRALAIVQIAMGIAALATLPAYPLLFELMQAAMKWLPRQPLGYVEYNVLGYLMSALIMMPASLFAGMTLPLLTAVLYRSGRGEREIGRVYGWNTLGGIVGVLAAGLWLMPAIGLKNMVVAGAAIDVALGVALILHVRSSGWGPAAAKLPIAIAGFAGVALLAALFAFEFDQTTLASGVFRTGHARLPQTSSLISYADGRTASVSVIRQGTGNVAIATNGKTDAAINMERGRLHRQGPDEYTMTLLGALPLAYRPQARRAAVIGHGSGLTAHVMLGSPAIERLDIIEIEPEMIRAARSFLPRVARAYDDPRARFQIDDARAWFARSVEPYDVIVSEPSNPWVSGVASLFTVEFYRHAKRALAPGGLFVQWFHLYETDRTLVRSIIGAVAAVFPDYVIYASNDTDVVLVAASEGALPPITDAIFRWPAMKSELDQLEIETPEQLRLLQIANRRAYGPLLEGGAINSDYHPTLEYGAARARFRSTDDASITDLARDPVPVLEMLSRFEPPSPAKSSEAIARESARFRDVARGNALASALTGAQEPQLVDALLPVQSDSLARLRNLGANAGASDWLSWQEWFEALLIVSKPMIANGRAAALEKFVTSPSTQTALARAPADIREKVAFLQAVGARRLERIERDGARLLAGPLREVDPAFHAYTLVSTISACLAEALDPACAGTIALLDLVQDKSPVFDLLRAHRQRASVR